MHVPGRSDRKRQILSFVNIEYAVETRKTIWLPVWVIYVFHPHLIINKKICSCTFLSEASEFQSSTARLFRDATAKHLLPSY